MTAPAPDRVWFVVVDGKPYGPCSTHEMHEWLAAGKLRGGDLAAADTGASSPEWKPLWQYPEFDRREDRARRQPALPASFATLTSTEIRRLASRDVPARRTRLTPESLRMRRVAMLLSAALLVAGLVMEWVGTRSPVDRVPKGMRDTPKNREGGILPYSLPEGHPPVDLPDPSEHKPIFILPGRMGPKPEIPESAKP